MNELPPDDSRLSAFLRRYQPAPPKSSHGEIEEYLLARIEQDVQRDSQSVFWLLSSAILTGMIMGWAVYRYSSPPQVAANVPELEHFVLENWNMKPTEATYFNNTSSLTSDWLSLTGPAHDYLGSRH
jgi:hypothetical protein